jgi:FkbM family methyltransferase
MIDHKAKGVNHLLRYAIKTSNGGVVQGAIRDVPSDWIIFREIFFYDDYKSMADIAPAPKVIYDIGANAGIAALYMRRLYPRARIIGFEPSPAEQAIAEVNYAAIGDAKLYPFAIGDKCEEKTFYTSIDHAGGQSFDPGVSFVNEATLIQVPVRRLDSLAKEEQLPVPDLIKIDIEGYEVRALKGMTETLAKAKHILLETHGADLHAEVLRILHDGGFEIIKDEPRTGPYRILHASKLAG